MLLLQQVADRMGGGKKGEPGPKTVHLQTDLKQRSPDVSLRNSQEQISILFLNKRAPPH